MQGSIQQQTDPNGRHVKDDMSPFHSSDSSFQYLNINAVHDERLTIGQRVADAVAAGMGSWWFIIVQSIVLAVWILLNTVQLIFKPFDPYPYILLNLTLSFQAAFAAPFIMISQNRQAAKDRLAAEHDYQVNVKTDQDLLRVEGKIDQLLWILGKGAKLDG